MASWRYELDGPPEDWQNTYWLPHLAGFILIEDVRNYARDRIEPTISEDASAAAEKAIDDALYGLMMVVDGVSGGISNDDFAANVSVRIRLRRKADDAIVEELDLFDSDGVCMAYHGWIEGDFGGEQFARPR